MGKCHVERTCKTIIITIITTIIITIIITIIGIIIITPTIKQCVGCG